MPKYEQNGKTSSNYNNLVLSQNPLYLLVRGCLVIIATENSRLRNKTITSKNESFECRQHLNRLHTCILSGSSPWPVVEQT